MHPSRRELRRYCDQRPDEAQRSTIGDHLEACEFCREYCDEFRVMANHIEEAVRRQRVVSENDLADRIFERVTAGMIIALVPAQTDIPQEALLAADGSPTSMPRLENLGTLYSENPEVVLRIMRDNSREHEYLQLVSEDPALISCVLVQIPELGLNILTDDSGRAEIDWRAIRELARYNWRIKLPDAEFSLSPLEYDPDQVQYQEEIELQTNRGDRVAMRFEGQVEGKRLTLRILQLGGRPDFGTVHVAVSQSGEAVAAHLSDADELHLELTSPRDTIAIRLFAD